MQPELRAQACHWKATKAPGAIHRHGFVMCDVHMRMPILQAALTCSVAYEGAVLGTATA